MKKNKSFLVTFVVTVAMLTCSIVSCAFLSKVVIISWRMHKLTKEAEYYLEYYSAEKQVEALAGVNSRRAVLLKSDDNFTAFIANLAPIAKIGVMVALFLATFGMGMITLVVIRYNKEVYKNFFICVVQLLTLTVIFVYSKLRRKPEVFQKYRRRSMVSKRALV